MSKKYIKIVEKMKVSKTLYSFVKFNVYFISVLITVNTFQHFIIKGGRGTEENQSINQPFPVVLCRMRIEVRCILLLISSESGQVKKR